jgi:hypothetical protein
VSADNAGNQFSQVWSSKEPHLGCCRFLHFRPHLVTFRRHVQFDEYIKGGSQLFPLRLAKRNLLKGICGSLSAWCLLTNSSNQFSGSCDCRPGFL